MPIRCDEYDKIEIVCMFQYPVTLLIDNQDGGFGDQSESFSISGIAKDTKRNALGEECIALSIDNGDSASLIVLTSIISMTVNIQNPHFQLVTFAR